MSPFRRRHLLFIRRDSLDALAPVLRVYEGCARALLGEVEGANVTKLHRYSGKVTYLVCPGLERDPDPRLELRIKVTLPAPSIDLFDYSGREDRPRLGAEPGLLSGAMSKCPESRGRRKPTADGGCLTPRRTVGASGPEAGRGVRAPRGGSAGMRVCRNRGSLTAGRALYAGSS